MSNERPKIIFVHDEDSGFLNSIKDVARNLVKKRNGQCSLCKMLLKGKNSQRNWQEFTWTLKVDFEYMLRDHFLQQFHRNDGFPVVFLVTGDAMTVLISKEKMDAVKDIQELEDLVIDRLDSAGIIETHF